MAKLIENSKESPKIDLDGRKDQIHLVESKPIEVSIVFPREDCIGPRGKLMPNLQE